MSIIKNSDEASVQRMLKAIKDNSGYCPCSLIKTEDTKCMCKEFRDMKTGTCHCGLYSKVAD